MRQTSLWQAIATLIKTEDEEIFFQALKVFEIKFTKILAVFFLISGGAMFLSAFRFISLQDVIFRIIFGTIIVIIASMLLHEK